MNITFADWLKERSIDVMDLTQEETDNLFKDYKKEGHNLDI